jgi:hypothetical protein
LFLLIPVVVEGSLQADPRLASLEGELVERQREYRASLRREECELTDLTRTQQANIEARNTTTEQVAGLKVRPSYIGAGFLPPQVWSSPLIFHRQSWLFAGE